jgi:hypothetical protein
MNVVHYQVSVKAAAALAGQAAAALAVAGQKLVQYRHLNRRKK